MRVRRIDHATLLIPEDGVDDARRFYGEQLGFGVEGLERYRRGEEPFVTVRLARDHALHLWPTDEFEPSGGYDHVALSLAEGVDAVRERLRAGGVDIDDEARPLGATGEAPAVFVTDPFGYRLELRAARDPS